jgi:hypothetical protein
MSTLATQETDLPIAPFIDGLTPAYRQEEAKCLLSLFESATGVPAKVWGDYFIIGFDHYEYQRKNSKEWFRWFKVGFTVRPNRVTLYLVTDLDAFADELEHLGPHTRGRGCLYIKKLAQVDMAIVESLIKKALKQYEKSS